MNRVLCLRDRGWDSDQVECQGGLKVWVCGLRKRHVKKAKTRGQLQGRVEIFYKGTQPQCKSLLKEGNIEVTDEKDVDDQYLSIS